MDYLIQIIVSGLTLGSMYALSAVGLSLVWGSFNCLNMAHGSVMALGAYFTLIAVDSIGFPVWVSLPFAMVGGALVGTAVYYLSVHWMLNTRNYETNIIIATFGIGMVMENGLLKIFGGYPYAQPLTVQGVAGLIGNVPVNYRSIVIWVVAAVLMVALGLLLTRTRAGRAIRAVAQNRDGAKLMGVPVARVYVQVLMLASLLAAVSGILISTTLQIVPYMGANPLLKAFIVICLAGLGNILGALYAALLVGLVEASASTLWAPQYGFPVILVVVILALIWRPEGLFGRVMVARQ
ncbi:MAG: branched-chain amino acid ABC transporter permease [Alphaproteobacteria bacterium]|nr:branched-chain amino acid ABC transporter permease [Alphaproteobacteria bacterium]